MSTATVRAPAVNGVFYPADSKELAHDVLALLAGARSQMERWERAREYAPKALIVPHAGYVYSGSVAAHSYELLSSIASRIHRVVLVGPAHHSSVRGLALPAERAFDTPLGQIPLDMVGREKIISLSQVEVNSMAHAREHSLEVQLPFLQSVLTPFTLLPLVVGDATSEEVVEVLETVWGGEETLIIISSDLSHYLPYHEAQHRDLRTVQSILDLQPLTSYRQACGATPINGLILTAQKHGLTPRLLEFQNSGDTAGTQDQVVGYASLAFA